MLDFLNKREELLATKERFSQDSLKQIPYNQLVFCSIAAAQETSCSLKLVREEKSRRRSQFVIMDPKELSSYENYLRLEGMYDDVVLQINYSCATKWKELPHKVRAWAKIMCMYNHPENLLPRISEALGLMRKASQENNADAIMILMQKLKTVGYLYPDKIEENVLRDKLFFIAGNLRNLFSEEELSITTNEFIQDYSCTSDCFHSGIV